MTPGYRARHASGTPTDDNLAGYTKAIITDLSERGEARINVGSDPSEHELSRARGRIYNAARRAGLKVSTSRVDGWIVGKVASGEHARGIQPIEG